MCRFVKDRTERPGDFTGPPPVGDEGAPGGPRLPSEALTPEPLRGDARALGHRGELGPDDALVAHARAETAVNAGDDVLFADDVGVLHQAIGDEPWVLDHVGVMADDAGDEDLAVREWYILPHLPLVVVARVGRLERVSADVDLQDQVQDV